MDFMRITRTNLQLQCVKCKDLVTYVNRWAVVGARFTDYCQTCEELSEFEVLGQYVWVKSQDETKKRTD